MNLKPVNERLLVVPKEMDARIGSIAVPDTYRTKQDEKPEVGFVAAVDDSEDREEPSKYKRGDKIVFNKFAATDIVYRDKDSNKEVKYLIMLESSVLAVFEYVDDAERDMYLAKEKVCDADASAV
jgi:co-chaperonin GroES (HSP10)